MEINQKYILKNVKNMRKFAKNSKNVKNIRMFVKKVPALPLWQGKCAWEHVPTFPGFLDL